MENINSEKCKKCGNQVYQDDKYVHFSSGTIPGHSLSVKLRAVWCGNSGCDYQEIITIPNKTGKIP